MAPPKECPGKTGETFSLPAMARLFEKRLPLTVSLAIFFVAALSGVKPKLAMAPPAASPAMSVLVGLRVPSQLLPPSARLSVNQQFVTVAVAIHTLARP